MVNALAYYILVKVTVNKIMDNLRLKYATMKNTLAYYITSEHGFIVKTDGKFDVG
jgi:hypothetical protein